MINIALAVLKYYKSVHIISGSFFDSCDIYLSVRPQHTITISFVTGHFQAVIFPNRLINIFKELNL